ncbi:MULTISPECIES: acyl-CoA dehydrogenase family protein [Actinomadura]|uniref:Acyl-CoA dehydrogenase family protein n=1 Tax=Actinomadura yumaensis TaxID=111807 RepID=A0ABW2D309_9ACTN|nr:acyl-CoA dehydrogenase family protein [Actinomadura sp. J1-007]MWK38929.1 acyl-CoA dehydrogenase [Actinomadura sp. J1-007]
MSYDLRDLVRAFCADTLPMPEVRRLMGAEPDPALWRRFAALGLAAITVPEEYGGAGGTLADAAVVAEELGRALAPLPHLPAFLAASALMEGDEEAREAYLPGIVSGELAAVLARGGVRADGGRLTGTTAPAPDAGTADLFLVVADGALHVAETAERTPLTSIDGTRSLAVLTFDGTPARRVGPAPSPAAGWTVLAAEMAGGARAALDMAVAYAKVREQFGRPIGANQAVKHLCAELLLDVEAAASMAASAAREASPRAGAMALAYCGDAYVRVATECVQIHGGIGFTWEHDAHLYYKRAHASRALLGDPDDLYASLVDGAPQAGGASAEGASAEGGAVTSPR